MPVRRNSSRFPFALLSRKSSALAKQEPAVAMRRAVRFTCEQLESRCLMTTLVGGGFANGIPQERVYTYLDSTETPIRIAMWGTITAEFIFVRVDTTNATHIVDLVDPTAANVTAKTGADLFSIYVSSADPRSSISIGKNIHTTKSLIDGPMEGPVATGAGNLTVTGASSTTGKPITVATVGGEAYLGARLYGTDADTGKTDPLPTIPVLTLNLSRQIGVRPVTPSRKIDAGLTTASGVSLNRFFFSGTVTGRVNIGGSIDTFYCGMLLTGDATGLSLGEQPSSAYQHNFNVSGDLDNLITYGSIGTDSLSGGAVGKPDYKTGFRLSVGGHLGEVQAKDSFYGSADVVNSPTLKGLGTIQHELEGTGPAPAKNLSFFEGNAATSIDKQGVPSLGDLPTPFNNNSFAQAQFLATDFSSAVGHNAVQLEGSLDGASTVNDDVDIYAIALMGGQSIAATLKDSTTGLEALGLEMGIFGPQAAITNNNTDLVASTLGEQTSNGTVRYTATEPGIYYFAIAFQTDTTFAGTPSEPINGEVDYELDVTGTKNIGLGAISAGGSISTPGGIDESDPTLLSSKFPSIAVENGDLGAVISTGATIQQGALNTGIITEGDAGGENPAPFSAPNGNIRVIQAGQIGQANSPTNGNFAPDLFAGQSIGLVRSTQGIININPSLIAIGGNYQLVDATGVFDGNLVADKAVGTVRADGIGSNLHAPLFHVNADNKGSDGVIDLIDDTGDFGTLMAGGPRFLTGPGGNVRYIHVAPTSTVYNDDFFGGLNDNVVDYAAGVAATLTDDSGTAFTLTPNGARNGQQGDLTQPTTSGTSTSTSTTGTDSTTDFTAGSLSLLTYGIEDKGGIVVMNATVTAGDINVNTPSSSTGTTTGTGTGTSTSTTTTFAGAGPVSLAVSTKTSGSTSSVELGQVDMMGYGTTITFDPDTRTFTPGPGPGGTIAQTDSVVMSGKSRIDAFDIASLSPVDSTTLTGMTTVQNQTNGEIVNLEAGDVGTLQAHNLGLALSHTGSEVSGAVVKANNYPFREQRNLIQIGGTYAPTGGDGSQIATGTDGVAQTIQATGALANILVVGTIDTIAANTDKVSSKGQIDGIDGPVFAADPGAFGTPTGSNIDGNILSINIGQGLGSSGSGDSADTGIFADNAIALITNQGEGSDIRGDINALQTGGGLPAISTIDPITGTVIASTAVVGSGIGEIDLTDGAIIDSRIFTTSAIGDTSDANTQQITIPDVNTTHNAATPFYTIGNINLKGNGGIIGSTFLADGVNSISIKGGFGFINSFVEELNGATLNSITADGYGIRDSGFSGQSTINSIVATGTGKEIPTTDYTPSVRQSELGGDSSPTTGEQLDTTNDLDLFLRTTRKRPTRKGTTEAGVIDEVSATGSNALGKIQGYRITNTTTNFANSIGSYAAADYATGDNITTGALTSFSVGNYTLKDNINVAGSIGSISGGFLSGSTHINATGGQGTIGSITTKGGLNATINASANISSITVGTDLGSSNIATSGSLSKLYVKRNIISGANVKVAKTIVTLDIKHNLLGGATVSARKIENQIVGGQIFGNLIITGD